MSAQGSRHGQVITFYSYKGGVGRTFTLANVAALLVHWGFKVLCVDWDIEAPGLHFYFPLKKKIERGLYELIGSFRDGEFEEWRDFSYSVNIPRSGARVDIIYAAGDEHGGVVNPVDWDELYDQASFGRALEAIRDDWKRNYDFIFIDSRTGVTDGSAVCTVQLPDTLIFLLTANEQSLKGSVNVARKAFLARQRLPVEKSALRTVPVISRFDTREEYELSRSWKEKLNRALLEFYSSWVPNREIGAQVLEETTIPYIPHWSFGEEIIGKQERDSPDFISYYFTNLAAIIANRFEDIETFVHARNSYVRLAQDKKAAKRRYIYDVYISRTREWTELSLAVARLLVQAGFDVFHPEISVRPKRSVSEQLNDGLSRSRTLVFFAGEMLSASQLNDLSYFLREAVTDFDRKVIPISMARGGVRNAPELLRSFRLIRGEGKAPQALAGELAAEIASRRDGSELN